MAFLKKHYEKILVGLVLLGLAVAIASLNFKIAVEKEARETLRQSIATQEEAKLLPAARQDGYLHPARHQRPAREPHAVNRGVDRYGRNRGCDQGPALQTD